jgi:hypothetical protein
MNKYIALCLIAGTATALTLTEIPDIGAWGSAKPIVQANMTAIESAVTALETPTAVQTASVTNGATLAVTSSGPWVITPIGGGAGTTNAVTVSVSALVKADLIVAATATNLMSFAGLVLTTNDVATVFSADGTNVVVISSQIAE